MTGGMKMEPGVDVLGIRLRLRNTDGTLLKGRTIMMITLQLYFYCHWFKDFMFNGLNFTVFITFYFISIYLIAFEPLHSLV